MSYCGGPVAALLMLALPPRAPVLLAHGIPTLLVLAPVSELIPASELWTFDGNVWHFSSRLSAFSLKGNKYYYQKCTAENDNYHKNNEGALYKIRNTHTSEMAPQRIKLIE